MPADAALFNISNLLFPIFCLSRRFHLSQRIRCFLSMQTARMVFSCEISRIQYHKIPGALLDLLGRDRFSDPAAAGKDIERLLYKAPSLFAVRTYNDIFMDLLIPSVTSAFGAYCDHTAPSSQCSDYGRRSPAVS